MKMNEKQFNNILNECLDRLLQGETVEQCLSRYPEQARELEPLLRTALVARQQASTIRPRPEFKARARYEFRAALQEQAAKRQRRGFFFGWHSAWATAVASILAFLVLASGTVMAAENSMPDQPLYPVKLATEQVRLGVTTSPVNKAELYAELADRRVQEIAYVASKGDPEKLERVTERFNTYLDKIASLAEAQWGNKAAVSAASAGRQEDTAKTGAPPAFAAKPPSTATPAPTTATKPVPAPPPSPAPRPTASPKPEPTTVPSQKSMAAPALSAADQKNSAAAIEREKLKAVIVYYALKHPERLNEVLNSAPPAVRPALRKAIAESIAGYEKAIKNIEMAEGD